MSQRRLRVVPLVILALALVRACAADNDTIRVGLVRSFRGAKQITVLASSDYAVLRTGSADKLATCTNLEPITLVASATSVTLRRANGSNADVGASVVITPTDPSATIDLDSPARPSKQYRGTIEVSVKSGSLVLVNTVDLDAYLPGVLAAEMPSSYPMEALKAQAVAARNYTLCARRKHASLGYDLCDDSHCQVYDGTLRESPNCTRAVLATRGQILTYRGRPASTMYCADCGGVTECFAEAHSDQVPYLISVTEPSDVVHRVWTKTYSLDELSAKLVAGGLKEAEGLQKLTITKASSSGRALELQVVGNGTTTISGTKLRTLLGRDAVRSTLFAVELAPEGSITLNGKGFGHGIGLCQVGAKGLADAPHNYTCEQILAHYYPGTTLSPAAPGTTVTASKPTTVTAAKKAERRQAAALPKGTPPQPSPQRGGSAAIDVRVEEPAL